MNFLGTVSELTSDGKAVIIASESPRMGDHVLDAGKRKIGTIVRIFGPVDEPYVSVKTDGSRAIAIGEKLYIQEANKDVKNKRRHRRN
ncbi:MAG: H/ACA ribonucleoprotein complex subunit GAR1 [Candidatus Methanomethylophilaceae archaeon]|jgi:RNA-binding protein